VPAPYPAGPHSIPPLDLPHHPPRYPSYRIASPPRAAKTAGLDQRPHQPSPARTADNRLVRGACVLGSA
jgi:hypothetical protein